MQVVYSSNIMFSSFVTISERKADAQAVLEQEERVHMIKVSLRSLGMPHTALTLHWQPFSCSIPGCRQLIIRAHAEIRAAGMGAGCDHQAQGCACAVAPSLPS